MKRLIFLKVEYLELDGKKKITKTKEQELRTELCDNSIKQFKKDLKEWLDNRSIKITKEYAEDEPQVIIDFDEKIQEEVYQKLRETDIVAVIDHIMPRGEE